MGEVESGRSFTIVEPRLARAAIASAVLNDNLTVADSGTAESRARVGTIDLHPHQVDAIRRLRAAMDEFGGALLCDPVGTGKTFIALAIAHAGATAIVVAPAVLRSMWLRAAEAAGRSVDFVSFETLSRNSVAPECGNFLIVDEAHHARNPATKRFTSLSRLAYRKNVLLLTATPIHNRRRDLTAVLSIFLGARANRLTAAELGRCVLRRDKSGRALAAMPRVEPLRWCSLPETGNTLAQHILSLPPPLPPSDGGDGGVLIAHSLIRQWASSDAALRGGLVRRLHKSIALISALEDGTYPSRAELAAWIGHDDSVQLAFSALVASPSSRAATLLPVVQSHREALRQLLSILDSDQSRDRERESIVRRVRAAHRGEKIVAFTQFSDTAESLYVRLAADGGVAALSRSGARVAGGRMKRDDAIGRFAPSGANHAVPSHADSITLLITTDLLSEGVNLQDASVVIHLDLPWTPARMEQRLGRIARLGSPHDAVFAYAIRPPACTEEIINIERILRDKMIEAGVVVPDFPALLPSTPAAMSLERTQPALVEAVRRTLSQWMPALYNPEGETTLIGAVAARVAGFVAACRQNGRVCLIASQGVGLSDDPAFVLKCVRLCCGHSCLPIVEECDTAIAKLNAHLAASRALEGVGSSKLPGRADDASALMQRIARTARRARPHERAALLSLGEHARDAVATARGHFAERRLAELSRVDTDDETWLRRVIASCVTGEMHQARPGNDDKVIALILLRETAGKEMRFLSQRNADGQCIDPV